MADWRKLFTSPTNHSLDFFPPEESNGSLLVSPPLEVFEEGATEWRNSIIAQFLGKPPGFMTLQRTLTKLWEKKGNIHIKDAGHNLFIFHFENEQTMTWILENGPWHVQHNPMILRKWEPNIGKIDFALDKLPIWFHLHNIPLDMYTRTGLSYIASAIGIPLYMDSITVAKKKMSYAKVCVEASAAKEPPEKIDIAMQDGSITSIAVSIPWRPHVCRKSSVFGHTDKTCSKNKNKIWKSKKKDLQLNLEVETHKDREPAKNDKPQPAAEIICQTETVKGKLFSSKKFGSSTNKFALLCEEICPLNLESETETNSLEEETEDDTHAKFSNEIWEQLIDNATYTQKKTRAAAKEASQAWISLKPKKAKLMAKGVKKASPGPSSLASCS